MVKIVHDMKSGMVKVDGIPLFKARRVEGDGIVIQLCDNDRMRSAGRGSRFVEIRLSDLIQILEVSDEGKT